MDTQPYATGEPVDPTGVEHGGNEVGGDQIAGKIERNKGLAAIGKFIFQLNIDGDRLKFRWPWRRRFHPRSECRNGIQYPFDRDRWWESFNFIGRDLEIDEAEKAITGNRSIGFFGPDGAGKSTLLNRLGRHFRDKQKQLPVSFPEGFFIYLTAKENSEDTLHDLFVQFYEEDEIPNRFDLLKRLSDRKGVVLLDRVNLKDPDLEDILSTAKQCVFIIASTKPYTSNYFDGKPLRGLSEDEAITLLRENLLKYPLVGSGNWGTAEQQAAWTICTALEHLPKPIINTLENSSGQNRSLLDTAQFVTGSNPRDVIRRIVRALPPPEQQVFKFISAMDGAPLGIEHISALSKISESEVVSILSGLVNRALVREQDSSYAIVNHIDDKDERASGVATLVPTIITHFRSWAEENVTDLNTMLQNAEALIQALILASVSDLFEDFLHLLRKVEQAGILTLKRRLGTREQMLRRALDIARALGDKTTESWACNQLGTLSATRGDSGAARGFFLQALRGTQVGKALAVRNLLSLVLAPFLPFAGAVVTIGLLAGLGPPVIDALKHRWVPSPLQYSRDGLYFGGQKLHTSSQEQAVSIKRQGSAPLEIKTNVEGENLSDFHVSKNCASNSSGAQCTIGVTFTPTSEGRRSAFVLVTDDQGHSRELRLQGTGTIPAIKAPTSFPFEDQRVNLQGEPKLITITNIGTAPLKINSIVLSGDNKEDFKPVWDDCLGRTVDERCTIPVAFNPQALGLRHAQISIIHDASSSPLNIELTGTGVGPNPWLPHGVIFPTVKVNSSAPFTVPIENRGSATLHIGPPEIADNKENEFTLLDWPGDLGPGERGQIHVGFNPKKKGLRAATLRIPGDDPIGLHRVELTGTGAFSKVKFGAIAFLPFKAGLDQQELKISNVGPVPLTIHGISVSPAVQENFEVTTDCPQDLSESCTVKIKFKNLVGHSSSPIRKGKLIIDHDDPDQPKEIDLIGEIKVAMAGFDFKNKTLDLCNHFVGSAYQREFVIRSVGTVPLQINGFSLSSSVSSSEGQVQPDYQVDLGNCLSTANKTTPIETECKGLVTFAPQNSGTRETILKLKDNTPTGETDIKFTGNGINEYHIQAVQKDSEPWPSISVPSSADFRIQKIETPKVKLHPITNNGDIPVEISSYAVTGQNKDDFRINSNCKQLKVGEKCAVEITFTPHQSGNREATLLTRAEARANSAKITDSGNCAQKSQEYEIKLTGEGVKPADPGLPKEVCFGRAKVVRPTEDNIRRTRTATLTNTGSVPLSVTNVEVDNKEDFKLIDNSCKGDVAAKCEIIIGFKPRATRLRKGALLIKHDAASSPSRISLIGIGESRNWFARMFHRATHWKEGRCAGS